MGISQFPPYSSNSKRTIFRIISITWGGRGCVGGFAAHTPPIFPYLLRSYHFSYGAIIIQT